MQIQHFFIHSIYPDHNNFLYHLNLDSLASRQKGQLQHFLFTQSTQTIINFL
jgi:hypothetical protein